MQSEPYFPEEGLRLFEAAQLGYGQKSASGQPIQGVGAKVPLGHPGDRLNVPQPSGTGFDVRFQVVGGVVRLQVAFRLLPNLGVEELLDGPDMLRRQRVAHLRDEARASRKLASLEQRRHYADIGSAFLHTLVDRADAVANLEADIPEESNQTFYIAAAMRIRRFRHQQHDVDIGAGVQLAAAITS